MRNGIAGRNVSGNEQFAEAAFTNQSDIFDDLYSYNTIINYKRNRVREHVLRYLKKGSNILEINSGTGVDALYFAQNGFKVHATDISKGMQAQLEQKVKDHGFEKLISNELCSFTQLDMLVDKGPYDLIFSNFAGLNCTADLDQVLKSFSPLLNPGGLVTLVVLPKFCLWETMLLFKGDFKTAFRRFFSQNGSPAHVEGVHFKCWYYNPSFIQKYLKNEFKILKIEGLCSLVPPSYMEGFAERYPGFYRSLTALEGILKSTWPWKCIGDYYIISLRKQ